MKYKSFDEWYELAYIEYHGKKYQRFGQFLFNSLARTQPALANEICGSDLDPFHRDDRVPAFLQYVGSNWGKNEVYDLR